MLLPRLMKLQLFDNLKYIKLSDRNSKRLDFIIPKRGKIFDRNGIEIAGIKMETKVFLNKENRSNNLIDEIDKVYEIISKQQDKKFLQKLKKKVNSSRNGKFILIKNLSRKDLMQLKFNLVYFDNITIENYMVRKYNYENSTSCLIGSVYHPSDIQNIVLQNNLDYRVGFNGIEKIYNNKLSGKIGSKYNIINVAGKKVSEEIIDKPVDGGNIRTTIDQRLQNYCYKLMSDKTGAVTLLDCKTGDILAMCSTPNIDPNYLSKGMSDDEWTEIIEHNNKSGLFLNKNISSIYPAGSTFKIVSSLVGLMNGKIDPYKKFNCTGEYKIGNRVFHCYKKEGHGLIDFNEALAQSCGCYFYHLSTMIDIDDLYSMAVKLGFNQKLMPNFTEELSGLIPNRKWKKDKYKQIWYPGDNANASIGQGYINVTPIQLATMIARVATNINIVPKCILGEKTNMFYLGIDEDILNIVRRGLFSVVNEPYGIAYYRSGNKKYRICGKTGTAQVVSERLNAKDMISGQIIKEKHDHALFVGYAPYEDPRYAVSVVVEHGIGGSRMAVPVGSSLLAKALDLER